MKCKYCETELVEWLGDFLRCPNQECPHKSLEVKERRGMGTREYLIKKEGI